MISIGDGDEKLNRPVTPMAIPGSPIHVANCMQLIQNHSFCSYKYGTVVIRRIVEVFLWTYMCHDAAIRPSTTEIQRGNPFLVHIGRYIVLFKDLLYIYLWP